MGRHLRPLFIMPYSDLKAYYHEHLFCSSWLAIAMFQEDYYNLLSIIGDDYE